MKRNKMMRIAAVLLVVTLLSTCAISGTFAKYVTKASASDNARVAKWGVVVTTESDLFSDSYEAEDASYIAAGGTLSVDSAAIDGVKDNVVAPGTSGNGFTANITGTPEVATRFALKIYLRDLEDVLLPVGRGYTDLSGITPTGTFDVPNPVPGNFAQYFKGYAPVKWDLRITRVKADGNDGTSISLADAAAALVPTAPTLAPLVEGGVSLTDAKTIVEKTSTSSTVKTILDSFLAQFAHTGAKNLQVKAINDAVKGDGFEVSMDFDPNSNLNYRIEANWSWDFDDNGAGTYDVLDTYIGNVAAGVIDDPTTTTNIQFAVEASATQID